MQEKEFENLLLVEGINAKGFGTIAKMVMIDRRLHPYSKAIYSYFCSFAGSGSTAFPSVSKIMYDLNMRKKTYYKYFNPLSDLGYITVIERKVKGKFSNNIYKLNTNPSVGENILHGDKKQTYPQIISKKSKKSVDNFNSTVGETVPHGKLSPTTISTRTVCTTNINNNTINSFNNNINYSKLTEEEKNYINNWMYEMCED